MEDSPHISVLKEEVLKYLNPTPNKDFIDATFNGGGHSLEILEKTAPNGKILGIEIDKELLEEAKIKFESFKPFSSKFSSSFISLGSNVNSSLFIVSGSEVVLAQITGVPKRIAS